jgi:hypothetical protein
VTTTHTPGPWHVDSDIWTIEDGAHNPAAIASLAVRPERKANARLIAAAPTLLEACKIALVAYQLAGKDTPNNSTANALRGAIAKAEGTTVTTQPLKQLTDRVCFLEGALAGIANRIEEFLARPQDWSNEYYRVVLDEIAEQARGVLGVLGED